MAKKYVWGELELIKKFQLQRQTEEFLPLTNWLITPDLILDTKEQVFFEKLLNAAKKNIDFWNEETLKMRFVAPLISFLAQLDSNDSKHYESFYDTTISANVEGTFLQTETDFMLASGMGDMPETPYFHFQEYKRSKKSPPEPMAQLLVAFLIAQEKNKNGKPIYGLTIVGRDWHFVVMEGKKYAVSRTFDATQKEDLLKIIAVLRKFKVILETTLLD